MRSSTFNLINAISWILFGTISYFLTSITSLTAFIPVVAGIILLLLNSGVRSGKKIPGHVAVIITLIILFGLVKPILGALDRGDQLVAVMIVIMMITGILSMTAFVKEFISVRKNK
jgi:hypothetical protein